jgi:hypothetical protein
MKPEETLFEELWSVEYRISGDKPAAKQWARNILDRHAHLLAQHQREFAGEWADALSLQIDSDQLPSIVQAAIQLGADHIDPKVEKKPWSTT